MEFLHLGNIPQSLQGVNARETCTSFWTRRSRMFFVFLKIPPCARGGEVLYYTPFSDEGL